MSSMPLYTSNESQHHIGYKRTGEYIVKLLILGENNEHRSGVLPENKPYAKFRCSRAYVLDIYHPDTGLRVIESVSYGGAGRFPYKIGKEVEPENVFDRNPNNVCAPGIHYFLSEVAAIMYGWNHSRPVGYPKYNFNEDGSLTFALEERLCKSAFCPSYYPVPGLTCSNTLIGGALEPYLNSRKTHRRYRRRR